MAVNLYEQCLELSAIAQAHDAQKDIPVHSLAEECHTLPQILLSQPDSPYRWMCNRVYYISDIHLAHKVTQKFRPSATDAQITRFVKKIARDMFTDDISVGIRSWNPPIFIFGGDISSHFGLAKLFFSEFVAQWKQLEPHPSSLCSRERYIYAILGNHEFWDFGSAGECKSAYRRFFKTLGICFLDNSITWFGEHRLPTIRITGEFGQKPTYIELEKGDDEVEYNRQMRHIHNTMIVGGVGFAGCNNTVNADVGIYRTVLSREQEIEETRKWQETYLRALTLAQENNCVLIVLSHNPISDWKEDGFGDNGCIYFNGHNHRNYLYHDESSNIHIFSNNQIGYQNSCIQFKQAYIYNRANPFSTFADGFHEIQTEDYLRFYDYIGENIKGNGLVEHQIKTNNAKFYMIKHGGYYGFFLVSSKGTCICAGGRIKKISKCNKIEQFNTDFLKMIELYLKALLPYRNSQEQIARTVKEFGGTGTIHGCIVDIDFFNHIMLNPSNGAITYYYSAIFGEVEIYGSILALLDAQNRALADCYRKKLGATDSPLFPKNQIDSTNQAMQLDVKNSVYAISNRMNQLQRLFDKKVLRDWNESLLANTSNQGILRQIRA